jgi:rare lipoprotein A
MLTIALFCAATAASLQGQNYLCEDVFTGRPATAEAAMPKPEVKLDPDIVRLLKYSLLESRHRLNGLASYYSNSLDGTLTANGERYHMKKLSAAHLTLPLGSWVEIQSKATGKKIRLRVNDRGPYVHKFVIDLSRTAARALGVDVAEDRTVMIRIIALPGERPLSEAALAGPETVIGEEVDGR